MEIEKGKTSKIRKESHPVAKEVTEQLKAFTRTKKMLINALAERDKTIPELATELQIPEDVVLYNIMSLIKYNVIETGEVDDMEEYFYYKIKTDGKNKS
jgi:predicted transcriptional regulator